MAVYYSVFIVTLMLSYFLPAKTDKQWYWKLFWTFLPLFLFGALRVNFGNDYTTYEHVFNEQHYTSSFQYDDTAHSEYGFQFLCYFMPSYRSILVLNSLLVSLALAVFCNRNIPRKYLWLAVLLIFLNAEKNIYGSLVGIRNGLAVTVFLLGSVFIQHRKIILFAGVTILALLLHSSAIFFLPIAFIVGFNKKLSKVEIIIWISVIFVILISSLSGMMKFIEPYLVDSYESYTVYLEGPGHRGWLLTTTGLVLATITFLLFWKNRSVFNKNQNSLIRLGLLYVVSTLLGSMAFRIGYFYDMFFIGTVCTMMIKAKKFKSLRNVLCILSILMSIYSFFLWRSANFGNPKYDVYHSIWTLF